MKRMLCLLVAVILICSAPISVLAEDSPKVTEEYISLPVEYSNHVGRMEELEVMVKDGNVYVNAKLLAERLGYKFTGSSKCILISNRDNKDIPVGSTMFFYDSTEVKHVLYMKMVDTYEAPFASVKNEKGYWIPFEYSLLMLNSSMLLLDDSILIDAPHKDIIDYYYDIVKNGSTYRFDWNKDFGYTELDWEVICGESHMINVFNGLLDFDSASWMAAMQSYVGDSSAYDKKYGENLALLLCTESDEELNATVEKLAFYGDVFKKDGQLGKLLGAYAKDLDREGEMFYKTCEEILKKVQTNNASVATYNRAYKGLEDVLDKQSWFSDTGGNILEIQNDFSDITSTLGKLQQVAEITGYIQEFAKQDEFAVAAVQDYLKTSKDRVELPEKMRKSMQKYTELLESSMEEYSIKRFFKNNVVDWIVEGAGIEEILGKQARGALVVWNIASNIIPVISNGLDAADQFELAMYAQVFQADTFLNYQSLCSSTFDNIDTLSPEKLYTLSQYCYIYLKTCYIARNAAVGSLAGKSNSIKKEMQPLVDYQNKINSDIADILVALKAADETNEAWAYGFLPDNNKQYLKKFDNKYLLDWIENYKNRLVTDAYNKKIGNSSVAIPKINLGGDVVKRINAEIWKNLYTDGVVGRKKMWEQCSYVEPARSSYRWGINGDILSVVVESYPEDYPWWDYYVYNLSISDGKELSKEEILSYAGVSYAEYKNRVRTAVGSEFFRDVEHHIRDYGYDDYFNTILARTTSDENIIDSIPYINKEGQLCTVVRVHTLAAADFYWHNLNLKNIQIEPAYEKYIDSH